MKLACDPNTVRRDYPTDALRVVLFGQPETPDCGSAGEAVKSEIKKRRLVPSARAWDLVSIALSVMTADFAAKRNQSPDGWTREIELDIGVIDPDFWNTQREALARALAFLTTDRWQLDFHGGAEAPPKPRKIELPDDDCISLLSGGLDSLVGAIDLVANGRRPFVVSKRVRGDVDKQAHFASRIGGSLRHLQLNDNARAPGDEETSQRSRSLIFLSFGVLVASTLRRYADRDRIDLFVCENGFISINPPLTGTRLGSLSTRTAHPEFLTRLQQIIDTAALRVDIRNPYSLKTKGEMLRECRDQDTLRSEAASSTSCGRFQRFGYRHCGRCVPCQVRRAAFLAWGIQDTTDYVYRNLGIDDDEHARFDDVRSVAIALASVRAKGIDRWIGPALSSPMIRDRSATRQMVERGLNELRALQRAHGL